MKSQPNIPLCVIILLMVALGLPISLGAVKVSSTRLQEVEVTTTSMEVVQTTAITYGNSAMTRKTVTRSAYATSDKPWRKTIQIPIPEDGVYRSHRVRTWTKRGDAGVKTRVIRSKDKKRVVGIEMEVWAKPRGVFGARNWIGCYLEVDMIVPDDGVSVSADPVAATSRTMRPDIWAMA